MRSRILCVGIAAILFLALVPSTLAIDPLMEGCPSSPNGSTFDPGDSLVPYACQTIEESEPMPNGGTDGDGLIWYWLALDLTILQLAVFP